jgi:peptide/nickel transport system permease protein
MSHALSIADHLETLPPLVLPQAVAEHPAALTHHRPRLIVSLTLAVAAMFLLLLLIAAVAPELLVPGDPLAADSRAAFLPPDAAHWLGTDENGRDVLTRLVHGVRPSLLMGLSATAISVVLGSLLGLVAGLGGRVADMVVGRLLDTLMAFPEMLLALVVITFWGQGTLNAIVAVGIAALPRNARMVRAQTQVVRRSGYVEAARTLGLHPIRLIWRHILPNALKPLLVLVPMSIGANIAAGAALSFLGFGAPPPAPEWGAMLSIGRNFLATSWWLVAAPSIAITLTVLAITCVGRAVMRRSEGLAA